MSRDWTLYLEDIADACRLIEQFTAGAARFRDIVAHRYFALDPAVVWSIVQTKIPALSRAARRVLSESGDGSAGDGI